MVDLNVCSIVCSKSLMPSPEIAEVHTTESRLAATLLTCKPVSCDPPHSQKLLDTLRSSEWPAHAVFHAVNLLWLDHVLPC
jgi:hypothetical protein